MEKQYFQTKRKNNVSKNTDDVTMKRFDDVSEKLTPYMKKIKREKR